MCSKQSFLLKYILVIISFVICGCELIEFSNRESPKQEHNSDNAIIKKLNAFKKKWHEDFNQLNTENDKTNENITKKEKKLHDDINYLESYFKEAANYLEKYAIQKSQVEEDYKKLNNEIDFQQKSLESSNSKLEVIYMDQEKISNNLNKLEVDLSELTKSIENLETKLVTIQNRIESISSENEMMRKITEGKVDFRFVRASIDNTGYIQADYINTIPNENDVNIDLKNKITDHTQQVLGSSEYMDIKDKYSKESTEKYAKSIINRSNKSIEENKKLLKEYNPHKRLHISECLHIAKLAKDLEANKEEYNGCNNLGAANRVKTQYFLLQEKLKCLKSEQAELEKTIQNHRDKYAEYNKLKNQIDSIDLFIEKKRNHN